FQAISGFRSYLVLRGLDVSVADAPRVDAGGEAALEVVVRNTKRRAASVSLELEVATASTRHLSVGPAWVARLPADEEARLRLPWRPGDALRAVHWRATARLGSLVVREEEASARRPFVVVVDPGPAAADAKPDAVDPALEDLLATAAALARAAVRDGRTTHLL